MASTADGELRRRKTSGPKASDGARVKVVDGKAPNAQEREVVWGKTPNGEGAYCLSMPQSRSRLNLELLSVFKVPTTHDVLTLFHPGYPKSHLDILSLTLLGTQILVFCILPKSQARLFFLAYFAFWRIAYDAGLGWVLTKQSKRKWIVREMQRLGWLDEKRNPSARAWIRKQLAGKMGKDYSFDVSLIYC